MGKHIFAETRFLDSETEIERTIMKEKKEKWTENGVIGELITKEKYRFVDQRLLAEIVHDVFAVQEIDQEKT